jgi:hypothetical protein
MLHPDYQYNPKLIPAMVSLIASGTYPVVMCVVLAGLDDAAFWFVTGRCTVL